MSLNIKEFRFKKALYQLKHFGAHFQALVLK